MSRAETHKRWEFVKLCAALTKQGFHFQSLPGYRLRLDKIHLNWKFNLISDFTSTPHVNSFSILESDHNTFTVYFNQWADDRYKRDALQK